MKNYETDQSGELLGPGTDLIISLLGVLLLALAMYAAKDGSLVKIESYQIETIKKVAAALDAEYFLVEKDGKSVYNLYLSGKTMNVDSTPHLTIENDITLQRITFGEELLFNSGEFTLISNGGTMLDSIGSVLVEVGPEVIEEILIQGHTDTRGEDAFNIGLGADRSITVLSILLKHIDPHRFLISATTFGPYKPVSRLESNREWDDTKTIQANATKQDKALNRRTDIVLNYRENI